MIKSGGTLVYDIDVVIATKNSEKYLDRCIRSVYDQTSKPSRVIVVDQASSDTTRDIAKGFAGLELLEQRGIGLPNAWNQGIESGDSEFVALIDSDDYWSPNFLTKSMDALRMNRQAEYAVAKVKFTIEGGQLPPGFRPELVNAERIGWMPGTTVFRRKVFTKVGLFPEDFTIASDIEFFARLRQSKVQMQEVPMVGLFKLMHGSNFSLNKEFSETYRKEILRVAKNSIKHAD